MAFLNGGGDSGARLRSYPWEGTPLGAPRHWPSALKTAVSVMLSSADPVYIGWGPDLLSFYNDGYLPILGSKHPGVGLPFAELWPELQADLGPLIEKTLAGETQHFTDMPLAVARVRQPKRIFSFTYTPLRDDAGTIAGFYCTARETTNEALEERRQSILFEASERLVAARSIDEVTEVLRRAARTAIGAEGIAIILKEGDQCFYVAEDSVAPLWRGSRFPADTCVAGWAMQNRATAVITDVRLDDRIPQDAYAPTFVRSLVMAPIGRPEPVAAIGAYWSEVIEHDRRTIDRLEGLARLAAIAIENARLTEARDRAAALAVAQNRILELAVGNAPLGETLDAIVTTVERLSTSGVLASILLLDADGTHLLHGAAPSLPAGYNQAIDGIAVGPMVGSCGSAVHRGAPVFASDIGESPLWANFRDLALGFGLRACWSIPIRSARGSIMGTFAMYHREPREPQPADLEIVDFVVRTAGIVIDRAQSEAARHESEERLRLATDNAEVGFWDVDEVAGVLHWPPIVKAMFGISADVPVSMADFYAGLHPDDAIETGKAYAAAADPKRRALYDVEYRTIGKEDGVVRWVAAKGRGQFDEAGRCLRVTGTAIDVSRRKAMEADLRELNETLEARVAAALAERQIFADVVENSPAATMVCDLDYRIVAINAACIDAFERLFGSRPVAGDNLLTLLDATPEHREQVSRVWARALAGEEFVVTDTFGDTALNRIPFELRFDRLLHREGRQVGAVQTGHDISERVRAQAELELTQEALRQSQKMEAMGQLTGGVAHDFNNLLTPIVGGLDMLQRKGVGGEREQRMIAGALQSADRAKTLVQRLLAFARRQPLQSTAVDIARLIRGMGDLVASTTGPQINVVVEAADGLPPAEADPNQLEMALLNLAVNARDAMPDGGTLRISASRETIASARGPGLRAGCYIKLSVADTGTGMDEETLARAVEPFFSTKGVGRGTGLGLSMVHGLASQLGGELVIHSRPGLGTNMELWLPESAAIVEEPTPAATSDAAPAACGTALLVDDEELVRMSTSSMLHELGFEVVEAASAEDALRLIREGIHFDLLVTDHLMPGMTGIDLARTIRAIRPETPILLVSGYAEFEGVEPDLSRLVKPFKKDELAETLARLR